MLAAMAIAFAAAGKMDEAQLILAELARQYGNWRLPGSAAPTEALPEVFALKSTPVGIPNAKGADKFGSLCSRI